MCYYPRAPSRQDLCIRKGYKVVLDLGNGRYGSYGRGIVRKGRTIYRTGKRRILRKHAEVFINNYFLPTGMKSAEGFYSYRTKRQAIDKLRRDYRFSKKRIAVVECLVEPEQFIGTNGKQQSHRAITVVRRIASGGGWRGSLI